MWSHFFHFWFCILVLGQVYFCPESSCDKVVFRKLTYGRNNTGLGTTQARMIQGILNNLENRRLKYRLPLMVPDPTQITSSQDEADFMLRYMNKSDIVKMRVTRDQKVILNCRFGKKPMGKVLTGFFKKRSRLIPSSDGDSHFVWMRKFREIEKNIQFTSEGRIRMSNNVLLINWAQVTDSGLYSCLQVTEAGFNYRHFQVKVVNLGNSWLDFENPVCMFKCCLMISMVLFGVIAFREYYNYDQNKNLNAYENMDLNMEKKQQLKAKWYGKDPNKWK